MKTNFVDYSILEILTIVFIILKLCNVINWSWLYVLMPTIVHVSLVLLLFIIGLILILIKWKR